MKAGHQIFTTFSWSGFRYVHIVIRGDARQVRIHHVGCIEHRANLQAIQLPAMDNAALQKIYDLCRYTLAAGALEHLIDCPTREQAQYWGDAVHVAQSLWKGFNEPSYLQWYLECFLHVPMRPDGQISCVYPGNMTQVLTDYSLIPMIGQRYYHQNTGAFYKPAETFQKAEKLKQWYDQRRDDDGLVSYVDATLPGMRNFIDHPGLGWHDFPHRGIDRDGISCPLNAYYYIYVQTLAEIAREISLPAYAVLARQADNLKDAIRRRFFDGRVFHDACNSEQLSSGTSWQTNSLAVYAEIVTPSEATSIMQCMLDEYDTQCRCSPYFYFIFLPALQIAGLDTEAKELIKKEWQTMLAGDATTWEGFLGDHKDSLCHPWSAAPFLFLLEDALREKETVSVEA
jgi:alpha-L-rhamnosidase